MNLWIILIFQQTVAIALGNLGSDPDRVVVNTESAYSIFVGLDPSDEMGFALICNKL